MYMSQIIQSNVSNMCHVTSHITIFVIFRIHMYMSQIIQSYLSHSPVICVKLRSHMRGMIHSRATYSYTAISDEY